MYNELYSKWPRMSNSVLCFADRASLFSSCK